MTTRLELFEERAVPCDIYMPSRAYLSQTAQVIDQHADSVHFRVQIATATNDAAIAYLTHTLVHWQAEAKIDDRIEVGTPYHVDCNIFLMRACDRFSLDTGFAHLTKVTMILLNRDHGESLEIWWQKQREDRYQQIDQWVQAFSNERMLARTQQ